MSKKLLKESTVRRFMRLANIAPLTNAFLHEVEEPEKWTGPTTPPPDDALPTPPEPESPKGPFSGPDTPKPTPETTPEGPQFQRDDDDELGLEDEGELGLEDEGELGLEDEGELGLEDVGELDISSADSDKLANVIANALSDILPGVTMHVESEEGEGEPDMDLGDLEGLSGEEAFGAGMTMGEEEPEGLDEKHRKDSPDRVAGRKAGGRRVTPMEEAMGSIDLVDDEKLAESIYRKIMSRFGRKK